MLEFNVVAFAERLSKIPAHDSIPEPPERNEYLQRNVFDELLQGRTIKLQELDFDAFTLQDVTPEAYRLLLAENQGGWARRFNQFVKQTPVATLKESVFF